VLATSITACQVPANVGFRPDGAFDARETTCGDLVAPEVTAGCTDCTYDCMPNGCFNGYWCNTSTKDCVPPPDTCDAHGG
jgi:hypothetical protein